MINFSDILKINGLEFIHTVSPKEKERPSFAPAVSKRGKRQGCGIKSLPFFEVLHTVSPKEKENPSLDPSFSKRGNWKDSGVSFAGVSIDSREIKKDELFAAIVGENTDGHNYLKQVFEKGVNAAIVNKKWAKKNASKFKNKIFFVVNDTTKALGELAKLHKDNFNIPILCIAGSNGKTTTKDLISAVLSKKFKVLKNEGNLNNHIGLPLSLLKLNKSHQIAVLEIGSNHPGELEYLCNIAEPHFGLVTNIGREHLEFFGNINGVAKEEFTLYNYLKKTGGTLFLNLDDEYIKKYYNSDKSVCSFTYSYKINADVKGKFIKFDKNFFPEFTVSGSSNFTAKVAAFGKHSIQNGLAAAATGLFFNVKASDISSALKNYKISSSKRMEILNKNGILIINDAYNSNPESVKLGLETVKEYNTKGNKHIVLADMLEMGTAGVKVHKEVGMLVKKMKFDFLYTFGKNSYEIFKSANGVKYNFYFDIKEDLSNLLKYMVNKGDVIYVKGSRGMKMEEVITTLIN